MLQVNKPIFVLSPKRFRSKLVSVIASGLVPSQESTAAGFNGDFSYFWLLTTLNGQTC